MAQNIYDSEEFFQAYSRLPRSVKGLDGAPEWPSIRALLPDLRGASVLDLGCGFGWFCRWARANGAARVVGIDLSEKMLARARADTADPAIEYRRGDLETLTLGPESFGLVYSSLAFHYLEHLSALFAEVFRALAPGGKLVFSVEHPIYTAPADPKWTFDDSGRKSWPVNRYLDEGPRSTDWLASGVIKQHRMLATYINLLLRAGFALDHVEEWAPTQVQIAAEPEWAAERERPPFLLIAARRERSR